LTGRKAAILQKEEKKKAKTPESHKLNTLENDNCVRYQDINRNCFHQTAHVWMEAACCSGGKRKACCLDSGKRNWL